MQGISSALQMLQSTPLSSLVMIGGFLLLLLAFISRFNLTIELSNRRQLWAGIVGVLLLIFGVSLAMTSGTTQPVTMTAPPELRATINPEGLEVQAAWVKKNETVNFFDNDLTVTLNEFSCVDYTIDFTVGSPGFPNAKAINTRAGHTVIQIGKHPYEVRLSKEGNHWACNSAEFQVTKLNEIPPPTPTNEPTPEGIVLITIHEDETQTIFDGDLFITLFDTIVGPDTISGVIGSSNYQNQEIKSLKLGSMVTYQAKRFVRSAGYGCKRLIC